MARYEFYESNDGSTTDATIAHYGVKGMKWGVRKDRVKTGGRKFASNVKKGGEQTGEFAKTAGRKLGAPAKTAGNWVKKNPDKAALILMTAVSIPAYAIGTKLALDASTPGGSSRALATAGRMVRGEAMASPQNTRYMLKNADKWLYK